MRCIQSPCVVRFSCSLLEIDLFNPSTIFSGIIFPVNVHEHPHLSPVVTSVAYLRDFFFNYTVYMYTHRITCGSGSISLNFGTAMYECNSIGRGF